MKMKTVFLCVAVLCIIAAETTYALPMEEQTMVNLMPAGVKARLASKRLSMGGKRKLESHELRVARGAAPECEPQTFMHRSLVNHFSPLATNETYLQRYHVNTRFYAKGDPLYVYIGGESALEADEVCSGFWYDMAETHGAMMLAVEHRFYGQSQPAERTEVEALQYLTTQQALSDLVQVIRYVAHDSGLMDNDGLEPVVIAYGGSYPGSLAAWVRTMFPTLIAGSVASSAPVEANTDFTQYERIGRRAGRSVNASCMDRIDPAIDLVNEMMTTDEGRAKLDAVLQPCVSLSDPMARGTLLYLGMPDVGGAMQYYLTWSAGRQQDFDSLCDTFADADTSNPLLAMRHFFNASGLYIDRPDSDEQCLYNYFAGAYWYNLNTTVSDDSYRPWLWQKCSAFGYFRVTESPLSGDNDAFYEQLCKASFGGHSVYPSTDALNHITGGWDSLASNVFFTNGQLDGWSGLSVLEAHTDDQVAEYIPMASHCEDMYGFNYEGSSAMTQLHQDQEAAVLKWIAQARQVQQRQLPANEPNHPEDQ
jgi:Serine carboxypeptidase S28